MTNWQLQRDHEDDIANLVRNAEWRKTVGAGVYAILNTKSVIENNLPIDVLAPSHHHIRAYISASYQQIVYIQTINRNKDLAWVYATSTWAIWVSLDLLEPFRIPQLAGEQP